jgi:antigen 43
MTTTLLVSTEQQLASAIAEANAAASGSFVIDLEGSITETADLTAIDLQSGVTLIVDGSDGSGNDFTLDSGGSYGGISVDAGGAGSVVTIENLDIGDVPSAQPTTFASGVIAGSLTILGNATVDQTGSVTFGDASGPVTVTNDGTYDIDQLTAGINAGAPLYESFGSAIDGVAGSVFINEGTLVKLANADDFSAVNEIYVDVTDTGVIEVSDGNSNLRFDGAINSFSGTYIGGGMIDYGDPNTFQTLGNGSYCVVTLGNLDMSDGACTTSWADVTQSGLVTASLYTSITILGDWTFTSDNGLALEQPENSSALERLVLNDTALLAKTGGTGTTVIGLNFNIYPDTFITVGGSIDIAVGTLAFDGLTNNFYSTIYGAGTFSLGAGGANAIDSGTTISTSGWSITDAGTDVTLNIALSYSGIFTEASGATLTLTSSNYLTLSNATFDGTVTGGSGTEIVMAGGATLEIDDLTSFVGGSQIQNFGVPIAGFASGDVLRLEGFGEYATINGTSPSYNSSNNATTLTLTDNGSVVATLDLAGGNYTNATVTPDASISGAIDVELGKTCFCRGTLILTDCGEVAVEDLAVDNRVVTPAGEVKPIIWIGVGRVLVTPGRRSAATPVLVRKGALADNVPHRDLRITKGHSLFLDDTLIPAEYLVNHRSILWDDRAAAVEFYHIELATHDVLLADGAPAESYRDDGNRWLFQNANGGWDETPKAPFAPVLTGGPVVDAVWRRLLDRAGPRPRLPLTDEPDLHLMADGNRIDGSRGPNGSWLFDLPRRPLELRVASRAGSPAELGLARDPRVLGVAVRQVRLWQGRQVRVLDASDESLVEGFHPFETDNLFRWTDGDAALPVTLLADIEGACQFELLVGGAMQYPLFGKADERAAA